MNKTKFSRLKSNIQTTMIRRSPEILTGIGVAGLVTTAIFAVKATPKALDLIANAEEEKQEELTKLEVVKVAWKPYIPAAISGATSIACLIGATSVNAKRNAALAAAYKLSETALVEYKDKVIETIGEKKEKEIREEISKDRLENNPVTKSEIFITEKGKTLCYESISGRYFESDMASIKSALNETNSKLLLEDFVSLSQFFDALGLGAIGISDDIGWCSIDGTIKIDFDSHIAADGRPCIVLNYDTPPKYNFDKIA